MSDITEITQLVLRERQGRDRGWWPQMGACYHPDSLVNLSWFLGSGADFTAASQQQSEGGNRAIHRLSPPVVHLSGHRAFLEMPTTIMIRSLLNEVEVDLTSYTRLLYQVEQREGTWKIQTLICIYESDTITPALSGTTLKIGPQHLAPFRKPYRCLAFQLSRLGLSVRDDVYGDDQPDRVNALYEDTFKWLQQ